MNILANIERIIVKINKILHTQLQYPELIHVPDPGKTNPLTRGKNLRKVNT